MIISDVAAGASGKRRRNSARTKKRLLSSTDTVGAVTAVVNQLQVRTMPLKAHL
jgi:hypothetical protein